MYHRTIIGSQMNSRPDKNQMHRCPTSVDVSGPLVLTAQTKSTPRSPQLIVHSALKSPAAYASSCRGISIAFRIAMMIRAVNIEERSPESLSANTIFSTFGGGYCLLSSVILVFA